MVDFITNLLLVAKKNAILVVCNRMSKITHFVAITKGMLAERLARLFRDNVWKLYRLPESVVSDCHISNSKTYSKHVWLQYNIKSLWLFGLICAQNSVSSSVLYNGLNSTKSLQLFYFIWVKICSHIHFCSLPNYLLQTLQIYLDFTEFFPLQIWTLI